MNSRFHLLEFTILTSWIHDFIIQNSRIPDFNFMNSRFQLHELTISTPRIHDFNFTNSRSELHELTILTSWIPNFNFTNSRFQLHEFTILNPCDYCTCDVTVTWRVLNIRGSMQQRQWWNGGRVFTLSTGINHLGEHIYNKFNFDLTCYVFVRICAYMSL